ncbi:MAG: ATPase, T2SS/T4P/T4SS family [archaeon]|nr:ATPase, T2SS/T4P/T4SS family [archaeon]
MADYMDDLFAKIKGKKAAPQSTAEKKSAEKISAPQAKNAQEKKVPAASTKREPTIEEIEKKLSPKKTSQGIRREEPIERPQRQWPEPEETQETPELVIPPAPKTEVEVLQRKMPQREQGELKDADIAKVNQKLAELRKDLPPQEKVSPENPESVPEEAKSRAEKDLEKASNKEIVEEYDDNKIYRLPGEPLLYYWTPVARPIGGERSIINTIKEAATRIISIAPYKIRDQEQRRNVYFQKVLEILRGSPELNIPKTRYEFYADAVVREMIGYGLIDNLIKDDNLEEIMVIGPNMPVYVFHRKHEMMLTNIEFYNDNEIQDLVNRIARQIGRRVDLSSPLLDARLPDGSRVNATMPPASVQGSTLTIRKFREEPYSIIDLIKNKTLDTKTAGFLWVCTEGLGARPANILIAGGTGSGKTTTLNVLASFIPDSDRVITIEDTAELNLPLKHWIRMEARPPGLEGTGELTLDILTKNSLRMRPDRIIVGEIRHDEAFSLFTAFNTGHDGSLGTVHANSPNETIVRVTSPPMNVPEVMMSGLNFILVQHRLHNKKLGTIRRVTEIAEVTGALKGKAEANTVFKWEPKSDTIQRTKTTIKYINTLQEMTGKTEKEIEDEIEKRAKYLEQIAKKEGLNMKEVSIELKKYLGGR